MCLALAMLLSALSCYADSIETQNNPVANGTIHVADGDTDRSDWEEIPWYEFDDDLVEFFPVDIDRVQIAHDASNIYFHVQALAWEEAAESWRIGTYLDTDQDTATGYHGGFLAVGAEYLLEADATHEFTAATQTEWGWNQTASLVRDQTSMVDVEVAVPRSALGNPAAFDFLLFANNFCCDYQTPDDAYPNGAATPGGNVFTYELGAVSLQGDFDNNGALDVADINQLNERIRAADHDVAFDLNSDNLVDDADRTVWVQDLKMTFFGDADLDRDVDFPDFVSLADHYGQEGGWGEGDFDGSSLVGFPDFTLLANSYGMTASAAAVPEPSTCALLAAAACVRGCFIRPRHYSDN
jgi:hypothetical protein